MAVWGSGHKVAMELAMDPKLQHNCCTNIVSKTNNEAGLVGWHTGLTLLEVTTGTMFVMNLSNAKLRIEPLSEVVHGRELVHINDTYLRRKDSRDGKPRHVQVDMAALFYWYARVADRWMLFFNCLF